jgi:hypothetical protein
MKESAYIRWGTTLAAACLAVAFPVLAQDKARPPGTVPIDSLPPPPPASITTLPPQATPDVTQRKNDDGETVEEYRINGRLYMMRVTPRHGHPYVLVDSRGDGTFTRQDHSLDDGVRVPQWVLMEF